MRENGIIATIQSAGMGGHGLTIANNVTTGAVTGGLVAMMANHLHLCSSREGKEQIKAKL
jgi:hypothetical protein